MRYVGERECCYDPTELGFPSISGCHAIVYVNPQGLFGFHNLGNERPGDWAALTGAWGKFRREHVQGAGAGSALYGVCYPETQRGYTGVKKAQWLAELDAFGRAVGYTGSIWGYDLADAGIPGQAYVNFFHIQGKCVIQARVWVRGEETKGANTAPTDHKTTRPSQPIFELLDVNRVTTAIAATPIKTYYPEKLR
jgi:hypothetical protein